MIICGIQICWVGGKNRWKKLALQGKKISAIKLYKKLHDCSLMEAKKQIDNFLLIEEGK